MLASVLKYFVDGLADPANAMLPACRCSAACS
jgi:hypothetical protein